MMIGIDIGATSCRAVVDGRPLAEASTPTPPRALGDVLRSFRPRGAAIEGVGIGFAASVGADGRVAAWSNRPAYVGLDVDTLARSIFDAPVVWLDDCAAAAVAEHGDEATTSTLYVGVGTGIGAGFVDRGRLLEGATRSAMALGHVRVPSAGDAPCTCGARGCVQAVASGRALASKGVELRLPPGKIAASAAQGDPQARSLLMSIVEPLAEAVALACKLLDPTRVVLGGGLSEAGPWLTAALGARVPVPVVGARHGRLSAALGALAHARAHVRRNA
ncbi:uncharacterized protein SOCEGT47_074590 [Sorangium cellulosum]|uniref:ROK family protein n=1 Tax=Sorangium cellulosum TaxID=56 RepID=A0A4P2QBC1_SORCE|nr:ROK family protein [Sorangium cellulosum]AUX26889.1 uncharacterized protein SOCEGT47_074590 [Sorangium cellulosum]